MGKISDKINETTNQVTLQGTRTNWVDDNVVSVSNDNSGTLQAARFQVTKDSNDTYMLEYIIDITAAGGDSVHVLTLGLGGTTFAPWDQSGAQSTVATGGFSYTQSNQVVQTTDAATSEVRVSGRALLSGKPSWFDDNLETSSGLPIATDTTYGVIDGVLSGTYDLSAETAFTSGTLRYSKVGNLCTITVDSLVYASSQTAHNSNSNPIPVSMRPSQYIRGGAVANGDTVTVTSLSIYNNGNFGVEHWSDTDLSTPGLIGGTPGIGFTMSWTV
jgi:hypothetical protein